MKITLEEILLFAFLYTIAKEVDTHIAVKKEVKLLPAPKDTCTCCKDITECGADCRCCLGSCYCGVSNCACTFKVEPRKDCPRCKSAWAYYTKKDGTSYCDLCGTIWHLNLRTHTKKNG